MFKTSGGKYIAPQVIENVMKQSRFIEQVMVVGEGQKMPAALIQLNEEFVKEWGERKNLHLGSTLSEMVTHQELIDRVQEEIDFYNQKFGNWEKIKRFELTPDVWSIEEEQLTPTMKLKRRVIKERYIDLYNKIYSN
jgi:long-chain acyl-CoA synthetase